MRRFATGFTGKRRNQKGDEKTPDVVNRKRKPAPFRSGGEKRRFFVGREKDVPRYGQTVVLPHTRQGKPRKKLHDGKLFHRRRHILERFPDFFDNISDDVTFGPLAAKFFDVFGRIFLRAETRP